MNEYRPISAELQHNFHNLPHFNSKTTKPIFTIFLHDLDQLLQLLTRASTKDSALRFSIREQKVKTVNFDVGKNRTKLIGYHGNVPWTTAKLMAVF